jgi:hypothetical protein
MIRSLKPFFRFETQNSLKLAVLSAFLPLPLLATLPTSSYALEGHFKSAIFSQSFKNSPSKKAVNYDLRIKERAFQENWSFALDYQISGIKSSDFNFTNVNSDNPDRLQLFRLSDILADSDTDYTLHRIDRLSATYSSDYYSFTLGRQALSWGNGMAFNPLDRVNPFSPIQIDKSYKPGVDMITGQNTLENGDQFSWFILPKRDTETKKLTHTASSYGVKLYHFAQDSITDQQWLLMKDASEQLVGWQLSQSRENGLWNLDLLWSYDNEVNRHSISGILNWQNSISIKNRQAVVFAELFYNGYGSAITRPKIEQLSEQLLRLQSEGKVFNSNHYYTSIGMTLEVNPLLSFSGTLLSNWQDNSQLLSLQLQQSVTENDQLFITWQQPFGKSGSEFTGLQSENSSQNLSYSALIYLQWEHFFRY